jgi:hypothetical protein
MDPILFVITIIAAAVAGAAVLFPSETSRRRSWDEDELSDQLGAGLH